MKYSLKIIDKSQIVLIKPLWEKLNSIHLQDSHFFKEHFQTFTFEKRSEKFRELRNNMLYIKIAEGPKKDIIGYCVSPIEKSVGEIASIFVEEKYRKYGIGKQLIDNSIKWLKENNCSKILVAVAEGHESVFKFYAKFGFYPRLTYLQLKDNSVKINDIR